MCRMLLAAIAFFLIADPAHAQYMGNYTANQFLPRAPPQPPGTFSNPYGNSPRLYDGQGQYHGNLNTGSPYSPDSINNPYGAGSRYRQDSPSNPYGTGMGVYR